ncbi:MAG: glycosyltransferase family 4 protein [Acidobacteriia bacterium]|nr:glycosyltransferase family 4 protein [Terriglobia bacterium]
MRILIAAPVPKLREGGVAGIVYNMADSLRALGHDVQFLFLEDLLPRPVAFPRFSMLYFSFRLAREIFRRRAEFDVVNIHAPAGFAYGLLRRFRRSAALPPYVMLMHGIEERRNHAMSRESKKGRARYFRWKNRVWQRLYHMPLYRWSITTADHAMVSNREAWSVLQLQYNREAATSWFISNGAEPRFLLPRNYPGGPAERLLFAGSWIDHKGVFYLRQSFEALAIRHPAVRLTIAGCGADAQTVKQSFSPSVRDRVEVLPFVPTAEMPALYSRHDIFVLPSLMEGMPVVLVEALATGMPVVTTETCGMIDLVEGEYNGLLVKPADSAALVAAVERLIESPELRRRLGLAAQETMKRRTWDHVIKQVEKIFALAVAEWKQK